MLSFWLSTTKSKLLTLLKIKSTKSIKKSTGKYTVKSGDTLWAIAQAHNTTVQNIISKNHLANPNTIYIGQVLNV